MIASGSVLTLKTAHGTISKSFLIENFAGKLLLAQPDNPYSRLHFTPEGLEYKSSTPQSNNLFSLNLKDSCQYSLTTVLRDKTTKKDSVLALGVDTDGTWQAVDAEDKKAVSIFNVEITDPSQVGRAKLPLGVPAFCFEKWQLRRFLTEGYLHIPDVVSSNALEECVAVINHELGLPGRIVAGGIQEGESLGKLAGNLSNCSAVRGVLRGPVEAVLNAVFGANNFENSNLSAQIALRFPELNKQAELESADIEWHTDGLRQGHSHGFSLLLGVCLSDVQQDFCGNLALWPGSHLLLHQCKIPPYGALDLQALHRLAANKEHFTNFAHPAPPSPSSSETNDTDEPVHNNVPDLPRLGRPLQLKLRRGDIVLAHSDLAHAGAPNYCSTIRHMLYFRLKVRHSGVTSTSSSTSASVACETKALTPAFSGWEEVVDAHVADMWADLPVMRRELGEQELRHTMSLYVPHYGGCSK